MFNDRRSVFKEGVYKIKNGKRVFVAWSAPIPVWIPPDPSDSTSERPAKTRKLASSTGTEKVEESSSSMDTQDMFIFPNDQDFPQESGGPWEEEVPKKRKGRKAGMVRLFHKFNSNSAHPILLLCILESR